MAMSLGTNIFCAFRGQSTHWEGRKARRSFLKKRTKKLLSIRSVLETTISQSVAAPTDKSFLLLFFKKEALPFFVLGTARSV
jgi:hypothetical protein